MTAVPSLRRRMSYLAILCLTAGAVCFGLGAISFVLSRNLFDPVIFGRRAADTTLRNLAEYLGHERADLVPRHEGEQFLRGVDTLREGVDRLQARLDVVARRRRAP